MMSTRRSDTQRVASLRRAATRKAPDAGGKRLKTSYEDVQQGIKQLYPKADQNKEKPDIDIVLVPGLGANPDDSWKSAKTEWNWTTSPDGLIKDFPRARILLYMYESAWNGPLKVKNYMSNIALTLLTALRSMRQDCKSRPIVFIGHSMGGLVVAKAISYAEQRPGEFPLMFEATSAAIFFGTPFKGAPGASVAAMWAQVSELTGIGQATPSKLLDYMKPDDEQLRELRNEFTRAVLKLDHKIQMVCFWEEQPTDWTKFARLPSFLGIALPRTTTVMVDQESATFDGYPKPGIAADHRGLVKFDGPKDGRWSQVVRENIRAVTNGAHLTAKNRLSTARGLDWQVHKGIQEALGGAQVERKRREIAKKVAASSWITNADEYSRWFSAAQAVAVRDDQPPETPVELATDGLWIRGREGRGKTGATIAVLNKIEAWLKASEDKTQDATMLAYFFCESVADFATAEDLVKSLLSQLIAQETALASHAAVFVKATKGKKDKDNKERPQGQAGIEGLQPTLENLWQVFQSMLSDDLLSGCRVYFVINNMHVLPEDSDSTTKLMALLAGEILGNTTGRRHGSRRIRTKWFITSRNSSAMAKAFSFPTIRLVDLEDEKYGDKVRLELRKHARARVASLEVEKKYDKALTYFASSLIGNRATDTHWIDITCVQLEQLPETENQLRIRRKLESTPEDLGELLTKAWQIIFASTDDNGEKIKETLRALVLTFEDPTVLELGVLTGMSSTNEELDDMIDKCKPLLVVKRTVNFMNTAVKAHLLQNSEHLLGISPDGVKWQHGILALHCLSHLKEKFGFPEPEVPLPTPDDATERGDDEHSQHPDNVTADGNQPELDDGASRPGSVASLHAGNVPAGGDQYESDDDSSSGYFSDYEVSEPELNTEGEDLKDRAHAYAVRHWLHHGSKATPEFADYLSQDDFWELESRIRRRWLNEYVRMTGIFDGFDLAEDAQYMTPLHVAASIGFRELVVSLINNGHSDEIHRYDAHSNKPVSPSLDCHGKDPADIPRSYTLRHILAVPTSSRSS
ncbi:hypothetical protein B0H67DRAFT_568395 [Lasiosphaeris hirsuta]|uniref:DUF676 domain-containing protein n=1 Tax=Lasiosphaeris hirsuta TaxID=260670 RepID=A0AA40E6U6_9PEZI|nr:hypothetical protein B0H67DRAFT_568395 [Lasiosphaeris hirsuta]